MLVNMPVSLLIRTCAGHSSQQSITTRKIHRIQYKRFNSLYLYIILAILGSILSLSCNYADAQSSSPTSQLLFQPNELTSTSIATAPPPHTLLLVHRQLLPFLFSFFTTATVLNSPPAQSTTPTAAIAHIKRDGIDAIITFNWMNLTNLVPPSSEQVVRDEYALQLNETAARIASYSNITSSPKQSVFGVMIRVTIMSGLLERGPQDGYALHIHKNPIADDGDCGSTGLHLNTDKVNADGCYANTVPTISTRQQHTCPCRLGAPINECESGNLSGKWGLIRFAECITSRVWYDPTLTINGAPGVVGRSVALHWPNRTTLTCANIYALDSHAQPIVTKVQSNDASVLFRTSMTWSITTILTILSLLVL
ncbi:hypothetical protein BDF22DRAFT_695318 [Syncephalis plumigaleata]|nr:hypothetical protein BDF22DRAFT_695318 [Syncephalis plumigaleata]